MGSFNEDNIIDVNYTNTEDEEYVDKNKEIRGEPLFYTTTQVSEMVGVEPSTIRFWSKRFEDLLDIEISNRNKQYKKSDIEKLKFIKKLAKEDGMTLQQIEDYCNSKGFDIDNIKQSVMDSSNPLAIQTFISAMTIEIDKKLNSFADDLLNRINDQNKINFVMQQEINDKLQETIAITVDEIVSEKLNQSLQEFKSHIDTKEQEATKRDNEIIEFLKKSMEERKKENELQLQQQKKGFFSRLLGK